MKNYVAKVLVDKVIHDCPVVSWQSDQRIIVLYDGRFREVAEVDPNYRIEIEMVPPRSGIRPQNNNYAPNYNTRANGITNGNGTVKSSNGLRNHMNKG
jgi:hypothetical protein